ncbi:MAG: phosphatidylserine decarboxylase [Desulfobacter sp.]|nr:MAG: phosphatidylserine decarboxylase [Desulfobacter sp.]
MEHQYIHRATRAVCTESLKGDPIVNAIYSSVRENAGILFNMLVSPRMTALVGAVSYDLPFRRPPRDPAVFLADYGIDLTESAQGIDSLDTYRKIFERQIRYWELRPMPKAASAVVAPADARLLSGSFARDRALFIKDKFFEFTELLGADKPQWLDAFREGDFSVSRLTPDKYHYNHTPVAGRVADIYEIDGCFHSCNPGAVVRAVSPYSKNRRVVTIIDTDVPGGTGVGLVAMVEVVAMMIGRIVQCYSRNRYEAPEDVVPGLFLEKGCPKSLFRPGSSTTILVFQKNRVGVSRDLVENQQRTDARSRFSMGFGRPLVETEVMVREVIATGTAGGQPAGLPAGAERDRTVPEVF